MIHRMLRPFRAAPKTTVGGRRRPGRRALLTLESLEKRELLTLSSTVGDFLNKIGPQLDPAITSDNAPLPVLGQTIGGVGGANISGDISSLEPKLTAKIGDITPNFTDDDISKAMDDVLQAAGLFNGKTEAHLNNPQTGDNLDVTLHLGKTLVHTDSPKFNLGLPSLPFLALDVGGQVSVDVKAGLDLTFGLDAQNNPFIKPSKLDVHAEVGLKKPSLTGKVGFLLFTATPTVDMSDPQNPKTLPTGFSGDLNIVIPSDLNTPVPTPTLTGHADVNLTLTAEFADPSIQASAPSVSTDFKLHWGFNSSEVTSNDSSFGDDLKVSFNDVRVNLGSYLTNMVGPVIQKVQQLVDPYKDFFNFLASPVPVVSDLAKLIGKDDGISLLDIAGYIGGSGAVPPDYATLITVAKDVIKVTNVIEKIKVQKAGALNTASIDIGSFDVVDNQSKGGGKDLRDLADAALSGFDKDPGATDWSSLQKIANDLPLDDIENKLTQALGGDDLAKALSHELTDALKNLKNGLLGGNGNYAALDLEFPVTDHPAQAIFGMLIGKDADLVSFTADLKIHVPTGSIPLWSFEGLEIDLTAGMNADAHLKLAYDTFGLREFVTDPGHNFLDLLDGFYLDPTTHLHIDGTLGLSAGANVGLLEAKINGHLDAAFDIKTDPNIKQTTPGHVRLNDFLNSDTLFDVTGSLNAGLDVHLREGVDPVAFHQDFTLASVPLASFKLGFVNPFKPAPTVKLASYQMGNSGPLLLNIGARSDQRNCQPFDRFPTYLITHADPLPGESGEAAWVTAYGFTQRYANVTKIIADGRGDPNKPNSADIGDVITIAPDVQADVEIHGGSGDSKLSALGSGMAVLWGGVGDDSLTGGSGPCTIHGGNGNDLIKAGSGNAILLGGKGKNEIHGGGGTNFIFGGAGDNLLFGGTGKNFIKGGTSSQDHDVITAGPQDDLLVGGAGNTIFHAGTGHDMMVGGQNGNQYIWHTKDDQRKIAQTDGPLDITGGGGENLVSVYGGPDADTFSVSKLQNDPKYDVVILAPGNAEGGFFTPIRLSVVEKIDIEAGGGENHVTVNDLTGTRTTQVGVDLDDLLKDHFGVLDKYTDHIVVNGTPQADHVTVTADLKQIQVPDGTRDSGLQGGVTTFSGLPFYKVLVANVNDDVVFNGRGGHDTFDVYGITGPTTIHGDGGGVGPTPSNDTFNVTVKTATDYAAPLTIDGAGGANALHIFEPVAKPDSFVVTKDNIKSGLLPGVNYHSTGGNFSKGVSLTTGDGGDQVQVLSTLPGVTTTITTGAGDDMVMVGAAGSTGNLDGIQGPLTVDLGTGAGNSLVLNDAAATAAKPGVFVIPQHVLGFAGPNGTTPVVYTASGGQMKLVLNGALNPAFADQFLVFDPTASLVLNTGAGAAQTYVLALTQPATVNGGPAMNKITAGFLVNSLDGMQASLTVHGGGKDELDVLDTQAGANQHYSLTANALFRTGSGAIFFDSQVNQLNLYAGQQGDQVAVLTTPVASSVKLIGGGGKNTLTGPDFDTIWTITGPNSGFIGSNVQFLGFQNLAGGAGNDHFMVKNGQGVSGTIDGGGGSANVLDYSDFTAQVVVDLGKQKATNVGGKVTGIQQFVGGHASDTLIGPDSPNLWSVTGPNKGAVSTMQFGNFTFDSFENLKGGASLDVFFVMPGGSLSGKVDGGGGNNKLDYSAYQNTVYVNLKTGAGTALGSVANIQTVQGGMSSNLLVGNGGATLLGGLGRNVLIAGKSAGTLIGGGDQDILIGGTTSYDTNDKALLAILSEWGRTDLSYAHRLADLAAGNGVPVLSASTVKSNGGNNQMLGNAGLDLFFGKVGSDVTDWDPATEKFVAL